MAESRLAAVLRVLDGLSERSAGQFVACCPAHPDSTPSLSVTQGDGGRLLLHCFAGCEYPAIRDALLACGVDPAVFRVGTPGRGAVLAEYAYTDEDGTVLYVKTRLEPKDFRLKAPDGAGGWIHSQVLRHAPRRVLYRLPEVKAAIRAGRPVYVVEGEKDADTLAALGLTATCNVEGAAAAGQRAKWLPAYGEQLAGARTVIVVADKDRPGYAHAQALAGKVTAVRTVIAAAGKDVTDHVTAGFGVDQLIGVDVDAALAAAPADPAEEISYDVNEYWEYGVGPRIRKIADPVSGPMGPVANAAGGLHVYADGVWQRDHGGEQIRGRVLRILDDRYRPAHAGAVIDALRTRAAAWNDDTVDTVHLNLPNGLLSWRTGLLLPHDPAVPTTIRIPVAWEERATCPVIDAWMAQVFPADALPFVHQVIGYALYNGNPLHKAGAAARHRPQRQGHLPAAAPGAARPGEHHRCHPPVAGRQPVPGRAAARQAGQPGRRRGPADLQSNRDVQAGHRRGHGDRGGQVRRPVRVHLPGADRGRVQRAARLRGHLEGFFSRWLVVPFTGYFPPGTAPTLGARLTAPAELQGLLRQAVAGLRRVMDRGSFTLPPSVQTATEEFRYVADPVRAFLRERTVGGADQWVAKADLYRAYEAGCTETGFQGMAAATFYERVHAAAVDVFGSPLRESKRNRGTRGLNGLRLATPADQAEARHGGTGGVLVPVPSQPVITRERMSTPASSASVASREMANLDPGVRIGPDSGGPAIRDKETPLAAELLGVARQQHIDLFDELELPDSPHADDGPAA